MILLLVSIILISLLLQCVRENTDIAKEGFENSGPSYEYFYKDKCHLCDLARAKYWDQIQGDGVISKTDRNLSKKWIKQLDPITGDETCVEEYVDKEAKRRADMHNITYVPTILFITSRSKPYVIALEKNKHIVKDDAEYDRKQKEYDAEKQKEDQEACE